MCWHFVISFLQICMAFALCNCMGFFCFQFIIHYIIVFSKPHNCKTTPHNNVTTVHYDKTPKHQDKITWESCGFPYRYALIHPEGSAIHHLNNSDWQQREVLVPFTHLLVFVHEITSKLVLSFLVPKRVYVPLLPKIFRLCSLIPQFKLARHAPLFPKYNGRASTRLSVTLNWYTSCCFYHENCAVVIIMLNIKHNPITH